MGMEKKKLKIAILSFYSGDVHRGVETYVNKLSSGLTALGHDLVVYQSGSKRTVSKHKTVVIGSSHNLQKKVLFSSVPFLNPRSLAIRRFTGSVLKQIDPDTDIVVATNGQWQSVLASRWCKSNKAKLVIPGQSGPGMDDKINLMTGPDAFVALTKHQEKWANDTKKSVRTQTIPNGVDLLAFAKNVVPVDSGLPKPVTLSVGALVPEKRHELAIKAVSKLKYGSLLIVGQGEMGEELNNLGNELLPGRFKITHCTHDKLPSVYVSADLFVFPTVAWESFGIVLLEAMASGLPVVISDDPIRREIVGDAGLFVDPTDSHTFSKKIEKALNSDWGNKSREQAKRFSWESVVAQYERLFLGLVQ